MRHKLLKLFFLSLMSVFLSYTLYVYGLQSANLLSTQRIILTILFVVVIFALFVLSLKQFEKNLVIDKSFQWGLLSTFLLINLFFVSFLPEIPYINSMIPTRIIEITPVQTNQRVKIRSFKAELAEGASLTSFVTYQGWETRNGQIISSENNNRPLVWRGKPGKTIEIRFVSCANCGRVNISWGDGSYEIVDLKQGNDKHKTFAILHEYPSLLRYRLFNLVALEFLVLVSAFLIMGWSYSKKRYPQDANRIPASRVHTWIPIAALALLTIIVYGLKLQSILFNDDWSIYYYVQFDLLDFFMLSERRPLHWFLMWLFNRFLPPHLAIDFTFGFIVVTLFLTVGVLYILSDQLLEKRKWFAFLFAALFLVFPSDYTRLYLTMANHRFAFLLMLIAMLLSVKLMKTNRLAIGISAVPLLILGLLIYEGQLGLLVSWPIILVFIYRKKLTWKKLFGLAGYYLVTGFYIIWRLIIQPKYYFQDSKLDSMYTLNPWKIFERLFYSLKTILVGFKLPFPDTSWMSVKNVVIASLLLVGIVWVYFLALSLWRSQYQISTGIKKLKYNFCVLIIGFVLWIVGYFPILLNYPANIYGHLSRINLFSVAGAVLVLLSLTHMFSLTVSKNPVQASRWTVLLTVGLIFLGGVVQLQTQESYNHSWNEQKTFYRALFDAVPNVKPETHFLFLLDGYQQTSSYYRPLFSSSWEAFTALRVLYDDADLMVSYQYNEIAVPQFPGFNILPSTLESESMFPITHPERLVVIRYNRESEEFRIQEDLSVFPGYDFPTYEPYDRIVPLKREIQSRKIVE